MMYDVTVYVQYAYNVYRQKSKTAEKANFLDKTE